MIRQHQIDPDVSKTGNPNTGTTFFIELRACWGRIRFTFKGLNDCSGNRLPKLGLVVRGGRAR